MLALGALEEELYTSFYKALGGAAGPREWSHLAGARAGSLGSSLAPAVRLGGIVGAPIEEASEQEIPLCRGALGT
jgi:hypothetical protein